MLFREIYSLFDPEPENTQELDSKRVSKKWQRIKKKKKKSLFLRSSIPHPRSLKIAKEARSGWPTLTFTKYWIYLILLAAQPQPTANVGESLHIRLGIGRDCLLYKSSKY